MKRRKGFTLVELLVVIAIIGLLVSITLPSLKRIVDQGEQLKCLSHLGGIGKGVSGYESDMEEMPSTAADDGAWVPGDSDAVAAGAYADETAFRLVTNCNVQSYYLVVVAEFLSPSIFTCPSDDSAAETTRTGDQWGFTAGEVSFAFNITDPDYHSSSTRGSQSGDTPLAADQSDAGSDVEPNANHGKVCCNVLFLGGSAVGRFRWEDDTNGGAFNGFGESGDDIYDYVVAGTGGTPGASAGAGTNAEEPNDSYLVNN